jgi:HEAT repeat protein
MSAALGRVADGLTLASHKLLDLLDDPNPHVRLRAARTLFYISVKLRESVDTEDRLDEVERELARHKAVAP